MKGVNQGRRFGHERYSLTLTEQEHWILAHAVYSSMEESDNSAWIEVMRPILDKLGGPEYLKRPDPWTKK